MFFVTSEHIPEGVGFQAFGLTHILWLLAGILVCVSACIFYNKLPGKKQKIMLKVLGTYIFLQEMIKNLVLIILGEFGWGYLPFHLCGIGVAFPELDPNACLEFLPPSQLHDTYLTGAVPLAVDYFQSGIYGLEICPFGDIAPCGDGYPCVFFEPALGNEFYVFDGV